MEQEPLQKTVNHNKWLAQTLNILQQLSTKKKKKGYFTSKAGNYFQIITK